MHHMFQRPNKMKYMLAFLGVLVVLTSGASCTGASIKPVIRKHFEDLSRQDLHHAKLEWLRFGEEGLAELLKQVGRDICIREKVDWQGVMTITRERGKEIDLEGETLCSLIRNHIDHVFEPFTTILDQCGQASHSGPLGTSAVMALKSVVKHVCTIPGEQILEMVNVCSFSGKLTAPECDTFKIRMEALKPGNTTRTLVEEVCDILPLGRDCFLDEVTQECQLEFTKKAWEDLLNSIISPCHVLKV